jgi:hypothetical protein
MRMPVDKRSIEVAMARSFRDSELEASVASVLVLILVILSPYLLTGIACPLSCFQKYGFTALLQWVHRVVGASLTTYVGTCLPSFRAAGFFFKEHLHSRLILSRHLYR